MPNELNDSLDDLFGGPVSNTPREATNPNYTPLTQQFIEGCAACRGSGTFKSWSGRTVGPCFKCKGKGKLTFKSSPEARAKGREDAAARKERKAQEDLDAFKSANPTVWAWIEENAPSFSFAAAMYDAVKNFGSLTENQLAACERCIAKRDASRAAAAARVENAPVVDSSGIDRLKASFDTAIAYSREKGLKLSPMITISGITISPAKASSVNAGALYVKQRGGEYLGKIQNGKFFAQAACTDEQKAKLLSFISDPAEAAKVYGQTTGTCCICNASLRSEWKNRGIGPICAQKFGW